MRIFLVRHGAPVHSRGSSIDPALSSVGESQMNMLSEKLKTYLKEKTKFWSSSRIAARDSARILRKTLNVTGEIIIHNKLCSGIHIPSNSPKSAIYYYDPYWLDNEIMREFENMNTENLIIVSDSYYVNKYPKDLNHVAKENKALFGEGVMIDLIDHSFKTLYWQENDLRDILFRAEDTYPRNRKLHRSR